MTTGGIPPNFPDFVQMMPIVFQTAGGRFQSIDPTVVHIARDILNTIGVFPVAPIGAPGDDGMGSPGGGPEHIEDVGEKPPAEGKEGHRFFPMLPNNAKEGEISGFQGSPAKMDQTFKGVVLKIAENILPEQKGTAPIEKGAVVEQVAEAVENKSSTVLDGLVKDLGEKAANANKMSATNAAENASMIKGSQMEKVSEMKLPVATGTVESHQETSNTASQVMAMVTPQGADPSQLASSNSQGNLIALANTSMIPLQATLTKEGVQAIVQTHPEHIDHTTHLHTLKHSETLAVPTIASPTDVQGLTIALTLPLGLLPVLPPHLATSLGASRIVKEDSSINSVVHRTLHHEKIEQQQAADNTNFTIPSDKPNLHRIPDGREISFITQMAQMGLFKGKKVEDSAFKLPDGLKLDPGYRMGDLLAIIYLAALCGASSLTQIGAFVEEHEEWLGRHFDMRRGAPAPLVFMWLFTRITPFYFTKIILQHIRCITNRSHGRRSPFNAIRIWETNSGLIFGQSKTETRAPSQSQILRIFDWEDATLILESADDPEEVRREVNCKLLMSISPEKKERILKDQSVVDTKSQEWNDAYEVVCKLELTLYSDWTVGQYTKIQEGVLKINRSFLSNLPLDFNAWNTLFYSRTDVEEQTVWLGEGRFLSFGEVTISHAMDNFDLLRQVAYKTLLSSTSLAGSVDQKRLKLWEDPDELLILLNY